MNTAQKQSKLGRGHPLCVLASATVLMACAWLLTPSHGPWLSNALAATLVTGILLVAGPHPATIPLRARVCAGAAALGLLYATLTWCLVPTAIQILPAVRAQLQSLYATLHRAPGPTWGIPILALTVLVEETVWRGVLIDWCEPHLRPWLVVLLAPLAYTIPVAFSGSPLLIVVALGLGAALTAQRLHFRSWVPCFVTHLTWNLLVFVVQPPLTSWSERADRGAVVLRTCPPIPRAWHSDSEAGTQGETSASLPLHLDTASTCPACE